MYDLLNEYYMVADKDREGVTNITKSRQGPKLRTQFKKGK